MRNFINLKQISNRSKYIYIFLVSMVLIGVISGSLLFVFLSENDQVLVLESIDNYFGLVKTNNLDYSYLFKNSLMINFVYFTSMAILGLSMLGAPFVSFYGFIKGFILGFMLSSILFKYKLGGVFLSLAYMFPHLIISMILTVLLSFYALQFSYAIFRNVFSNKPVSFKNLFKRYMQVYGICLVGGLLISIYEVFISPYIIKIVLLIFN